MFGLLVKVVGSYVVDPGSIPGSLKLRQKSVVGQEIENLQIWDFLKLEIFSPILKFTYLTASSSRFQRFGESHAVLSCTTAEDRPPHQLSRSLSPPAQPSNDDDGAAEPSHNMTNWALAGSNNVITELRRQFDRSKLYKYSWKLICVPGQGRGPPLLIYCRSGAAASAPPPSPAAGRGGTRPAHAPSPNPLTGGGIGAAHCKQLDGLKTGSRSSFS